MSRLTRRELISKVSQHTNIRNDAVEQVINGLVDVAVEEIINDGEFNIIELFSVTSKEWNKSYSINNAEEVPSRPRLIIKISKRLRELWKFRIDILKGEKGVITKDNWRDAHKHLLKQEKSLKRANKSSADKEQPKVEAPKTEDYNPFLDDDE